MGKYIRAMFHGSAKTKAYLWTIVLVALASVVCFGAVLFGASIYLGYLAFGGSIFTIAYSQLAVFKDVNAEIVDQSLLEKSVAGSKKRRSKEAEAGGEQGSKRVSTLEEEEDGDNPFNRYTKDNLKKYLVSYKVKLQNYRVLIDSSEKYHIKCCPAYVWSDKNYLFFLLMEKKPRTIAISRKETGVLRYEKGVVIKDIEEYKKVKDSVFLGSLFHELYPEYYKQTVNGLTTFMKNLFIIGEDIKVTAPSAYGIIKATSCRLELTDKQIDRKRFGGYFEEMYKENLLWKEKAIGEEDYKERTRVLLTALAEHEEKLEVFQQTIYQLTQYRLISPDYAEFYLDYRGKLEGERTKRK